MKGLDRLRELARAQEEHSWSSVGKVRARMMMQIADQIEREHAEDCFKMGERAAEDAEAIAWVREHGGLEAVREACSPGRPSDNRKNFYDRLVLAWVEEHGGMSHVKDIFNDFRAVVERLGIEWSESELHNVMDVLDKRPAPEVLDADGAEIREKRDAWWICEGDERGIHAERLRVETICPNGLVRCSPYNGGTWVYLEPSELYVNKPVPASDGKPLREGETVWGTGREQHEYVVLGQPGLGGGAGRFKVACHDVTDGIDCDCDPDQLTHERPESKCRDCAHWQKDPTADNMGVCWFYYHEREGRDCYAARLGDIGACEEFVPRGKALAGDA